MTTWPSFLVIGVGVGMSEKNDGTGGICSFSFMADDDNTPVYRLCYNNHAIYR
mgnify:CR=1 FL=1